LSLRYATPGGYYVNVSEGFVRGMTSNYSTGDSADRDTWNLGLVIGHASPRSRWDYSVNAGYESTSYESNYYNNNEAFTGGFRLARDLTAKTMLNLSGGYSYRTSSNTDNMQVYNLQVGLNSRLLPKVTYSISGGLQYSRSSNGWSAWSPAYNMSMGWKISQKLSASLFGSSWIQPSEIASRYYGTQNYASLYYTLGTAVNYIPVRRLSTTAQLLYRRANYKYMGDTTTGVLNNSGDDLYMARLAASVSLTRFLSLVASMQYQTTFSDIKAKDYDQLTATLGLRLKY